MSIDSPEERTAWKIAERTGDQTMNLSQHARAKLEETKTKLASTRAEINKLSASLADLQKRAKHLDSMAKEWAEVADAYERIEKLKS